MPRSSAKANGSSPEYLEMGGRLRAARGSRGLSLRVLAERLGVSPSLISQVETGRAKPSVSTLYAIASELGISLDELLFPDAGWSAEGGAGSGSGSGSEAGAGGAAGFERGTAAAAEPGREPASHGAGVADPTAPDPSVAPVQPAATRKSIRLASGVVWERLTTVSMPNVDFFYVTYEVGGASSPENEFQRHSGQEWGYILSGTLHVTIGFDDYVLRPGDAISFDSTTPHRLYNPSDDPVHAIWFMLGRRPVDIAPAGAQGAGGS